MSHPHPINQTHTLLTHPLVTFTHTGMSHTLSAMGMIINRSVGTTHTPDQPVHTIHTYYQHTLCQHTLSTSTYYQPAISNTLSTHPLSTHPLSTHPINTLDPNPSHSTMTNLQLTTHFTTTTLSCLP